MIMLMKINLNAIKIGHIFQIVFDDIIADMIYNKKLNSIVTELFIRGRKLNIYLAFITQFYFEVPKDVSPNTSHFLSQKSQIKKKFDKVQ